MTDKNSMMPFASHGPTYRADIDGLRAFAVAVVLIYHAFPNLMPAGFVGVDIFFVISGYLITGNLLDSLHSGSFSFVDFYARRIRRIFPALILVLFATFIFGWVVLFDDEFKQLGKHILRASLFISNFILWHESGYFDALAETKPLLHLWSLSIEEQFYLIWPLLILLIWQVKARRGWLVGLLAVLSFVWNIYQSQHDPVHDFYSPLTRFWELLVGALMANYCRCACFIHNSTSHLYNSTSDMRGLVGGGFLLLSIFMLSNSGFPGYWALLPVLGAALIISAGSHSLVNRAILSNPALVALGVISYPLYLWHWPILSFARIVEGSAPSVKWRCFAIVASILLAWLTYSLFEKPIRFGKKLRYKTMLLVLCMVCLTGIGLDVNKSNGFPNRQLMQAVNVHYSGDIGHDSFHAYFQENFYPCTDQKIQLTAGQWLGMIRCFQSKPYSQIDLVLLGDSHAEHLFIGVAEAMPQMNVAYYSKGSLPILNNPEFELIFNSLLGDARISGVLIAANWYGKIKDQLHNENMVNDFNNTVKALAASGKTVFVMADLPEFPFDPQRCKFQRPFSSVRQCELGFDSYLNRLNIYLPMLNRVVALNPEVKLIESQDLLCSGGSCSMAHGDEILYRDNNHLNIPGSKLVGQYLANKYLNSLVSVGR
jgi:peptidoglycan/LPS O-acetylase OafA/YrhL